MKIIFVFVDQQTQFKMGVSVASYYFVGVKLNGCEIDLDYFMDELNGDYVYNLDDDFSFLHVYDSCGNDSYYLIWTKSLMHSYSNETTISRVPFSLEKSINDRVSKGLPSFVKVARKRLNVKVENEKEFLIAFLY